MDMLRLHAGFSITRYSHLAARSPAAKKPDNEEEKKQQHGTKDRPAQHKRQVSKKAVQQVAQQTHHPPKKKKTAKSSTSVRKNQVPERTFNLLSGKRLMRGRPAPTGHVNIQPVEKKTARPAKKSVKRSTPAKPNSTTRTVTQKHTAVPVKKPGPSSTQTLNLNNIPVDTLKAYTISPKRPKLAAHTATETDTSTQNYPVLPNKIQVENKGASAEITNVVKILVGQLPVKMQEYLDEHDVKVEVVPDLGSMAEIPGFGAAVGIYLFQENVIRIPENIPDGNGGWKKNPDVTLELMAHEAAHAVDRWLGTDKKITPSGGYPAMFNFDPDLKAAYQQDLNNLTKNVPNAGERSLLAYITDTSAGVDRARVEAFAEVSALIITGGDGPLKSYWDIVRKAFPTFTPLVEDALENLGVSSSSNSKKDDKSGSKTILTRDVPDLINKYNNAPPPKGLTTKFINGNPNPGANTNFIQGKNTLPGNSFTQGPSIPGLDRFING